MYTKPDRFDLINSIPQQAFSPLKDKLLAKAEVLLSLANAKLYDEELKVQIDELITQIKGL